MKRIVSFTVLLCLVFTIFGIAPSVSVRAKENTIKDVLSSDKDIEKIQYVLDQGYMKLVLGKFYPAKNVKRNEFAAILAKLSGDSKSLNNPVKSTFLDVSTKDQFYKYIEAAKGYMVTYKNTKGRLFKPNNYITREDAVMSIVKILGYDSEAAVANNEEADVSLSEVLEDANKVSPVLVKYVSTAITAELIDVREVEDKVYFDPQKNITRKDLAVLIFNAMQNKDYNKDDGSDEKTVIEDEKGKPTAVPTKESPTPTPTPTPVPATPVPSPTPVVITPQTKFETTERATASATERTVIIKLVNENGSNVNMYHCNYAFRSGSNENVGNSEYRSSNQVGNTRVNNFDDSIQFTTNSYDIIQYSVTFKCDKSLYVISGQFDKGDKLGVELTRTYRIADLKCIETSADFFEDNKGIYELNVINPSNAFYSGNENARFTFNPSEAVKVYATVGTYTFIYKYLGDYEGAVSARTVDTAKISSLHLKKSDVKLVKFTHKSNAFLNEYPYIVTRFEFGRVTADVYGSLNSQNAYNIYIDSNHYPSFTRVYFCRDSGGSLSDTVEVLEQKTSAVTLGSNFIPIDWITFADFGNKKYYNIRFSDENGNVVRFGGAKKNINEFGVQIMDRVTGSILYTGEMNRFWNEPSTGLPNGRYKMKIYPLTVSANFNTCTYYDLSINGLDYSTTVTKLEKLN